MNEQKRRIKWIVVLAMIGCLSASAQDMMSAAPGSDGVQPSTSNEVGSMPVITPGSEVMSEPLGEPVPSQSAEPIKTEITDSVPPTVSTGQVPAESLEPATLTESNLPASEGLVSGTTVTSGTMSALEPEVKTAEQFETAPEGTPAVETQPAPVVSAQVPVEESSNKEGEIVTPLATEGVPEIAPVAETSTNIAPETPMSNEPEAEMDVETNVTTELIELQSEEGEPSSDMVGSGAKENLISISLDNVPLQDVMRMFARISGANIVAGTNLQGNITVNLKDVEWQPALRTILDTAGLTLVMKSPEIYSVVSKEEALSAPVTMDTIYLKYTTVTNVLPVIQKMLLSSNASVASFASANALVVQETSERLSIIKDVVDHIDRPRPQVFIEAKFVELNDQAIKDLGINWESLESYTLTASSLSWGVTENRNWLKSRDSTLSQTDNRAHSDGVNSSYGSDGRESSTIVGPSVDGTVGRSVVDTISQTKNVGLNEEDSYEKTVEDVRTAVLSAADFQVTLSALKQQSGVSVVSNPRIVVASGETATIHVGREDPNYVTKTEAGAGNTVQTTRELSEDMPWVKTGVTVDVRPVVNTESNITIRITPVLSSILSRGSGQLDGDLSPVSKREINSEFNLESGRTVAIGGLTETTDREEITKVPILGDIPIIGKYLFSHTHTEKIQDEVIIFVTVGMASPETITVSAGIPSDGKLIHRHLAQQAAGAEAAAKAGK